MKTISIKAQKILSFIPFVNAIVLFLWIFNYRVSINEPKIFAKSLLVILVRTIPLSLLQRLFLNLFIEQEIPTILINCIAIYIIPFSLAWGLISFQQKIKTD